MSMFSKLKQFKDLKDKAKVMQEMLAQETAEGSAAWGKVKVTVNGNQQTTGVSIDPSAMNDKAALETAIKEAFNDAISKIQQVLSKKMREGDTMDVMSELGEMFKQN